MGWPDQGERRDGGVMSAVRVPFGWGSNALDVSSHRLATASSQGGCGASRPFITAAEARDVGKGWRLAPVSGTKASSRAKLGRTSPLIPYVG